MKDAGSADQSGVLCGDLSAIGQGLQPLVKFLSPLIPVCDPPVPKVIIHQLQHAVEGGSPAGSRRCIPKVLACSVLVAGKSGILMVFRILPACRSRPMYLFPVCRSRSAQLFPV
jgi:hypothetical protein